MASKALYGILVILVVLLALESVLSEELPQVTLNLKTVPETRTWLSWADTYVSSATGGLLKTSISESTTMEAVKRGLVNGSVDVAISPHPFAEDVPNAEFMHFPVAVGGIVFIGNVGAGKTLSLSAPQVADILSGTVTQWKDPTLSRALAWLKNVNLDIKVVAWNENSTESKQVKEFLIKNTDAKWTPLTKLTSTAHIVSTMEDAVAYVKQTEGAFTWTTYQTRVEGIIPVQLFVVQTDDFVSPTVAGFKNALMPFKKSSDLPQQEQTSSWNSWTLTDMSKMPPDGSCMAMPPYPLSRFYYAIIKRDHTQDQSKKGSALASYLRLLFSPNVQDAVPTENLLAAAPPAGLISNIAAIKRIPIPTGEKHEAYLNNAPIEETKEENMENTPGMTPGMTPGGDMTKMQPASMGAVIAMMAVLMLSGVAAVAVYLLLQKFYFKSDHTILDHASWVPFSLKPGSRGQPKSYEPLSSTRESRV